MPMNDSAVQVSIIVVNYNAGELLTQSAGAALGSSAGVEVFVVDNGSADGSVEALRLAHGADGRLAIIENRANLGFAAANNVAIGKTKGEFILILNPDCVIRPDTIAGMLAVMKAHPEAGMAGPLIQNEDGTEQEGCRRDIPTLRTAFIRAFGLGGALGLPDFNKAGQPLPPGPEPVEAISGAFMFIRRAALERVGPLDEGYFLHCEDLDWCLRFTAAGYKILFVPAVQVIHHKGVCGVSIPLTVEWHKSRGMTRFFRKFHGAGPVYWIVAAGVWARFGAMAAASRFRRAIGGYSRRGGGRPGG
jgi:hypothetical protein